MNARLFRVWLSCSLLALAFAAADSAAQAPEPPQVPVGQPLAREVPDYEEFTGRTEASATVDIRARATGYLTRVLFKEGAEVKQGALLFEIDPRPYQAELMKAEAALTQAEARLQRTAANHKRAAALLPTKAISREEYDKITAERDEAEAMRLASRAVVEHAKLNLDYTKVTAPISGRVGRRFVTEGNLVKADETLLTTIVSQGPMSVYFDVDEKTVLRLRRDRKDGTGLPVGLGLADEKDFPRRGTVDFADLRVDPQTGTLRMRAVFANADGTLLPGLFVRVRMTVGEPRKALLVPEEAVAFVRGKAYLFVVSDKNVLQRRLVQLGSRHDGLRVVKDGVKATEWVVLGELEGLRAGMTVKPQKTPIPEQKPDKERR